MGTRFLSTLELIHNGGPVENISPVLLIQQLGVPIMRRAHSSTSGENEDEH